jgi:D-serine deaminase-like pyridoxal phosphate-dependent protein
MLNHSDRISLKQGDHVTFRPTQSEFVFLQFGNIAVYDPEEERIVESWPVFQQGA